MDLYDHSPKDIGVLGEKVAAEYLRRRGFVVTGTNIRAKFGELDIVARQDMCLHVVEVKTVRCSEFPHTQTNDVYDPVENLHTHKLRRVIRTAGWYVAQCGWEGEWQIDAILVWMREQDGMARVRYLPQIL